jgi:hypothetical protein
MADKNERFPENIPGAYYVDSTCIDCDLCRSLAPGVFVRDDEHALERALECFEALGLHWHARQTRELIAEA